MTKRRKTKSPFAILGLAVFAFSAHRAFNELQNLFPLLFPVAMVMRGISMFGHKAVTASQMAPPHYLENEEN